MTIHPMTGATVVPRTDAWADLRLRAASALVLAPFALAAIWFGGIAWLALLTVGFIGLGVEWVQLCGCPARSVTGISVPLVVVVAGGLAVADYGGAALMTLGWGSVAVGVLARALSHRKEVAWGVLYVGMAGLALLWLRGHDAVGRADLIFVVLVVWTTDIGAYVAGRLFGGRKLAPGISPGKTWSGAVGGLVAAMLLPPAVVGLMVGAWRPEAALVAALLSIVAQAGDLLESGLKRHFGVKDSGKLIPGHGGLLDRLDGLLTAAPAAALLVAFAGRGVLL